MIKIKISEGGEFYRRLGTDLSPGYCPFSGKICNVRCPHFDIKYNIMTSGEIFTHRIKISCSPAGPVIMDFETDEADLPKNMKLSKKQINKYIEQFIDTVNNAENSRNLLINAETWPKNKVTNAYFWTIFQNVAELIGNQFPIEHNLLSECIFNYKIKNN